MLFKRRTSRLQIRFFLPISIVSKFLLPFHDLGSLSFIVFLLQITPFLFSRSLSRLSCSIPSWIVPWKGRKWLLLIDLLFVGELFFLSLRVKQPWKSKILVDSPTLFLLLQVYLHLTSMVSSLYALLFE